MNKLFNNPAILTEDKKVKIRKVVFFFPIIIFIILLTLKLFWDNVYIEITKEDSLLEDIQFITYFSAAIIAITVGIKKTSQIALINSIILVFLGVSLFFISMEEISWGQRLFNINTPELLKEHNAQKEISIHNLEIFNNKLVIIYALVGLVLSFSWIPYKYGILSKKKKGNLGRTVHLFIPKWYIMFYFLPTFLLYTYWAQEFYLKTRFDWYKWDSTLINNFLKPYDQESVEFLLATGLFIYIIDLVYQFKYSPAKLGI